MHIAYHTANVSLRVWATVSFIFTLASLNIFFYRCAVAEKISMIYRVHFTIFRAFNIGMAKAKFADGWVKRKTIHTSFSGIHQYGRGAIDDVTRCHLAIAGLQKIIYGNSGAPFRNPAIHAKNSSNGNIHINITAAIQRIVHTYIL